jgi:hypothetical protein
MNKNTQRPMEGVDEFDQELAALYREALWDEDFQQQVAATLRNNLSDAALTALDAHAQAFAQDECLPATFKAHLIEMMPQCQQVSKVAQTEMPWWRRWFRSDWGDIARLPGPVVSIPAALMARVLFGVLLPTLLTVITPNESVEQLRGGDATPAAVTEMANANGISDSVRQHRQAWLNAIAELLKQGKEVQASEELQRFRYNPPSEP